MSIADQISAALRQQTQDGGWNISEPITYEHQNAAPVTGIRAVIKRGDGEKVEVLGSEYEEFTATVLVYLDDLNAPPRSGDTIRTETEVWRVKGPQSEIPGAVNLTATRKRLVRASTEGA